MSQRLSGILENYLRYHRIEGSTEATVKFYAKELRLFLNDLEKIDPGCQTLSGLSSSHVLPAPRLNAGARLEAPISSHSMASYHHLAGEDVVLHYVDGHDDACHWAERRLETRPTTGPEQMLALREAEQEVVVPVYAEDDRMAPPKPLLTSSPEPAAIRACHRLLLFPRRVRQNRPLV